MAEINVAPAGLGEFLVTVRDRGSETTHVVTVDDTERAETSAEELVAASFRFLLDREPKESILSHFDLSVIERYFPEYREHIQDYL